MQNTEVFAIEILLHVRVLTYKDMFFMRSLTLPACANRRCITQVRFNKVCKTSHYH